MIIPPAKQSTCLLRVTPGEKDVLCAAKGFHVNKGNNHVLITCQTLQEREKRRKGGKEIVRNGENFLFLLFQYFSKEINMIPEN